MRGRGKGKREKAKGESRISGSGVLRPLFPFLPSPFLFPSSLDLAACGGQD